MVLEEWCWSWSVDNSEVVFKWCWWWRTVSVWMVLVRRVVLVEEWCLSWSGNDSRALFEWYGHWSGWCSLSGIGVWVVLTLEWLWWWTAISCGVAWVEWKRGKDSHVADSVCCLGLCEISDDNFSETFNRKIIIKRKNLYKWIKNNLSHKKIILK